MILWLAAAWAMGLLGSLHCIGMCGGIVSVLSASVAPELRRRPPVHLSLLFGFNLGRVFCYAVLGAAFGALALGLQHVVVEAQAVLRALAGVVLVGFGLHLTGWVRGLPVLERAGVALWAPISGVARRLLPVRTFGRALLLGALWGFIPCGMVYSAVALAVAGGGPLRGALGMAAFGAGTLPAMLAAGSVAGQLLAHLRRTAARRALGFAMAALGVCTVFFVLDPSVHDACARHGSCCSSHVVAE